MEGLPVAGAYWGGPIIESSGVLYIEPSEDVAAIQKG